MHAPHSTTIDQAVPAITPHAPAPSPGATSVAGPPSRRFLERIGLDFARRHLLLSEGGATVHAADDHELLLIASSTRPAAIFNVGVALGAAVLTRVVDAEFLAAAIDQLQLDLASDAGRHIAGPQPQVPTAFVEGSPDVERDLEQAVRDTQRDLLSSDNKAPAVRLVDLLLFQALHRGASDVHIQPARGATLVRYRLDGVLRTVRTLPQGLAPAIVGRIKVMAALDIAEKRAPQDGRATVSIGNAPGSPAANAAPAPQSGRTIDLRVGTLPSTYGERVVLRLLDPKRSPHTESFEALGMPGDVRDAFVACVERTSGVVLSTGPTGSGKTTTLYATLAWLSRSRHGGDAHGCELNMMTVEDPVEYDLSGAGLAVSQTQVDPKKNLTFATALRHVLRQDPDVIMVGEIRDEATARIAVQASLTGHLVLSTLHTNDAATTPARLLDLGVEPYLVASSLSAVLAQRLVRRAHADCRGKGCDACLGTGFRGRTGVFELLCADDQLRSLIVARAPSAHLLQHARAQGMRTLRQMGLELVRQGVTTLAEVERSLDPHDPHDPHQPHHPHDPHESARSGAAQLEAKPAGSRANTSSGVLP